jgi:hypothetical protein
VVAVLRRVRRQGVGAAAAALVAACVQTPDRGLTPFAFDTPVTGEVLENSTACTVDAYCTLRVAFADTVVEVIYGSGEGAATPCLVPASASDTAFVSEPGTRVQVRVEDCGRSGAYLRAIRTAVR